MRNQYKVLQCLYENVEDKNKQREIQKIIDTCRKLAQGYIKLLNSTVPGKQLLNYKQNSINPVLQYIVSYIEHSTPQEQEKLHNYLTELMATVWLDVDPAYWEQEMRKLISAAVIYGEVDLDNLEDLAKDPLSEINTADDQYEFDEVVEPADENKVDPKELAMGIKVEMEHTKNKDKAKEIALQHLAEDPHYYSKLKKLKL